LNILFKFRSFEQLAFALKNKGCPDFTVLNIFFIIQDVEKLALALKNRVALECFTVLKYCLSFRIFEQLALALKKRVALKIHCKEYTFQIQNLSNLRLS